MCTTTLRSCISVRVHGLPVHIAQCYVGMKAVIIICLSDVITRSYRGDDSFYNRSQCVGNLIVHTITLGEGKVFHMLDGMQVLL